MSDYRLLEPLPLLGRDVWRAVDGGGREVLAELLPTATPPAWLSADRTAGLAGLSLPEVVEAGPGQLLVHRRLPSLRPVRVGDGAALARLAWRAVNALAGLPPAALPSKFLLLGPEANAVVVPCAGLDRWSAPEASADATTQTTAAAASYALGAALHMAASGKSPEEPPYLFRPLTRFLPDIDRTLAATLQSCLKRDPGGRPTIEELLSACPACATEAGMPPAAAQTASDPGRPAAATRLLTLTQGPHTVLLPAYAVEMEWRGQRTRQALPPGDNLVGRTPEAEVVLPAEDDAVSRRHARLLHRGDRLILEDLGSTNGTRVNGQRITGPVEVGPGDEIMIGRTQLRVVATP